MYIHIYIYIYINYLNTAIHVCSIFGSLWIFMTLPSKLNWEASSRPKPPWGPS